MSDCLSFSNMGVVFADMGVDSSGNSAISLELYEEGIMAYQKAIDILTGDKNSDGGGSRSKVGPTDPPDDINQVVAELHYRIGLCIVPFLFTQDSKDDNNRSDDYSKIQCTSHSMTSNYHGSKPSPITRSCLELSAHQFHTAIQFHARHEGANNALNLVTADATFGMSTDVKYVQKLFEEYASR